MPRREKVCQRWVLSERKGLCREKVGNKVVVGCVAMTSERVREEKKSRVGSE